MIVKTSFKRRVSIKNLVLSLLFIFCIFWIITPIIHEGGHAIAGLCLGEQLEEFHLPTSIFDHPYAHFKTSETFKENSKKIAIFRVGVTIPLGYILFFIRKKIINRKLVLNFLFVWLLFSLLVVEPLYQILPEIQNFISGSFVFISDLDRISAGFGIPKVLLYYAFLFQSMIGLKLIWQFVPISIYFIVRKNKRKGA